MKKLSYTPLSFFLSTENNASPNATDDGASSFEAKAEPLFASFFGSLISAVQKVQ